MQFNAYYSYDLKTEQQVCFTVNELEQQPKLTSLPVYGFIAQLVKHRTGIAEVTVSSPVDGFFRLLLSKCFNWKICCDDHFSLSKICIDDSWAKFIKLVVQIYLAIANSFTKNELYGYGDVN